MVDADASVRRGHPVIFGLVALFSLIEMCITAYLTSRYNANGYPSGHFTGTIRFGLFVSIWTLFFSIAYLAIFLTGVQNFMSSIASHGVWLFITWVFWLAYAASTAAMLQGPGRCGGDISHCTQNVAAEAFAWMNWILLTFAFIAVVLLGVRSMRKGERISGPLTA
ncbi:hypothetical protein FFLO_00552 [Filobasidium floriforme]|uniref:MARVEL domain-containing protein n=1 Tax=Filobasidium floriforme TaxID=5210 RepID=A0A8K0JRC1_9TREE|nr:uncharacterized protein HD553DRAFT_307177 [Filobasidium floriforme]KAG7571536.1 hypothetical protein FFLO_00552 [Filobasidium floriforme]KAH8088035.1 hypothetical protein HD553DRAFT_307177 [Filobasidium floriforme]